MAANKVEFKVPHGLVSDKQVEIFFTQNSTDIDTGSLIIYGGAGIAGSLNVGQDISTRDGYGLRFYNAANDAYVGFGFTGSITQQYTWPLYSPALGAGTSVLTATNSGLLTWVAPGAIALDSLNGINAAAQFLVVGTGGSTFNIASSGSTHTFNIPLAGTAITGLISPNSQTIAGDKTFSGNLAVTGNLTVNGTTTTVNSTVTTVVDPIVTIGTAIGGTNPSTDDNKDRGIEFKYYSGTAKTGFFGFDDSTGFFTFIPDASNSSEVFSGTAGTLDVNRITGSAASWTNSRTVTFSGGGVTGSFSIDGSANVSGIALTVTDDSIALGTKTTGQYASTIAISGSGITATSASGSDGTAYTIYSSAVSTNTASSIVLRDSSGNFSAGTITGTLSGTATSAVNAGFAGAATTAVNAGFAGAATTATSAGSAGTSVNSGFAGAATTATNAGFAGSSTNTANTNIILDTTSTIYLTGSRSNASIGSTPVYVLSGVSALGNTITATTFSGTATSAVNAGFSGAATTAITAGSAGTAVNAGFAGAATTATSAGSAGTAVNAGLSGLATNLAGGTIGALHYQSASNASGFISYPGAGYALTSVGAGTSSVWQLLTAMTVGSATTATNAGFAGAATTATSAGSAGTSINAGFAGAATTAVNAGFAGSSTNSANTNLTLDTTSTIYLTGSRSNASIGSTPVYVLSGVSALGNTITATTFSGSLSGTASSSALINIDASTGTRYLLGTVLNTASGSTQVSVGSGITIGNNLLTSGGIAVTNSTASTSTSTGALRITGGVGIGGSLWTATTNFSSISGVGHSNSTITSGTWAGNAVSAIYGGTGYTSYTKGDLIVGNGSTFVKLPVGTNNQYLISDSSTGSGLSWFSIPTATYGAFYRSTTQTVAADTATPVIFNGTFESNKVSIFGGAGTSSHIKIDTAGTYNIQFSGQMNLSSGNQPQDADFWFRVNGTDVANSNSRQTVSGKDYEHLVTINFVYTFSANQYFEVVMSSPDLHFILYGVSSLTGPIRPNIPSIILTVTPVMESVGGSGTGSTLAIAGTNNGDIQYKSGTTLGASSSFNFDALTSTFKITGYPIEAVSSTSANVKLLGDAVAWTGSINGTMLAINTTNTYTGDLFNAQIGGTSKFKVSYTGAVSIGNSFTLPVTDGTANQVLQTNGSGTVSWATVGSGSSAATIATTTDTASTLYLIGTRSNGGFAGTALYVNTGISALGNTITATTFSGTATTATNSASTNVVLDITSTIYLTGSRSNASIGSTPVYVLSGVSALGNTITATTFTGSLSGTASSAALVNVAASTGTRFLAGFSLNTATGSTQLFTGSGITIGDNRLTTGGLAVTSGTASTNTTTGALTVAGGVGITGQLSVNTIALGSTGVSVTPSMTYVGTAGTVISMSVLSDTTIAWEGSSGQLFSIDNNLSSGEIFSVSDISGLPVITASAGQTITLNEFGGFTQVGNGLASTSTTTGALRVVGGVGITGAVNIGGNTSISSSTSSTGFSTGALVVTGGVGIGQTLFIGGNLYQNTNAITAFDTGFRNRIINGDGNIDQRNDGSTTIPGVGATTFIDRWKMNVFGSGRLTIGKNYGGVTSPDGFVSYIGMKTTTTSTPAANDYNFLSQVIEGVNTIDLQWGTANAKPITLSFWAYSSLTGTFGGSVRNAGSGGYNRSYPFTYTISSSNTWEKKTIVIPGDTTGTWATSHLSGIEIIFVVSNGTTWQGTAFTWVAANATGPSTSLVNLIGTLNATLYLTGIQAEIGSVATPYERRNYGHEFALCQRYYQITEVRTGGYNTTGNFLRGSACLNTAARPISSPVFTVLSTDESSNHGTLNVDNSNFRGDSFRYLVQVTTTGDAFGQWKVGCDTEF
jgi:hypothetical protein